VLRARWTRDAIHVGRREMHKEFLYEILKKTYHLEDVGVGRKIILKQIVIQKNWKAWTEIIRLGKGASF
jgi:hypothetical protein